MHTHAGLNVEPDHYCLLAANVTLQGRYSWLDWQSPAQSLAGSYSLKRIGQMTRGCTENTSGDRAQRDYMAP